MGDFGKNYNPIKIYSNSKASKLEKFLDDPNPTNNDSISANTTIKTMIKAFTITKFEFNKICELCIRSN